MSHSVPPSKSHHEPLSKLGRPGTLVNPTFSCGSIPSWHRWAGSSRGINLRRREAEGGGIGGPVGDAQRRQDSCSCSRKLRTSCSATADRPAHCDGPIAGRWVVQAPGIFGQRDPLVVCISRGNEVPWHLLGNMCFHGISEGKP
jgi:hypothetical protein